jgi:hypothetical protein
VRLERGESGGDSDEVRIAHWEWITH